MAAGKWKLYDLAKKRIGDGTIDLDTNPFKMALFSSISNANTLSVGTGLFGDLTNELTTANGYTAGGITLSGVTWTNTAGSIAWTFTAPVWTAAGGSIISRFAVIYQSGTFNTFLNALVCVCLLDVTPADVTVTTGNTLTITPNAAGVFTVSGATVD